MKNCRRNGLLLLFLLATGCSTLTSKQLLLKSTSDSFCLVLARSHDQGLFSEPVKVDGQQVKLKRGSFVELELLPGLHTISARHGRILGRHYPPASTNVSGSAGERRYFSLVIQYRSVNIFVPVGVSGIEGPVPTPIQAAWIEIPQVEFDRQFPHAKFNH